MTQPLVGPGDTPAAAAPVSYASGLRRALNLAALVVALLPIPVALLQLLPAYRLQTRFLAFYAPLVCLLTLAYLFYVRDSLARMMFAHLLDPLPPRSVYYPERGELRIRRLWMKWRRGFLAILPGLLLLLSFACVMRYMSRLDESVGMVSATLGGRLAAPEDVGLLPTQRVPREPAQPSHVQTPTVRQRALDVASTDDIPYFAELTALYIASFLAVLVALVLMSLREYAKEALGLSEQDVVLGRVLVEPE
ncbi:MAG TPA: hypothetical protein VHL81_03455 [Gemmatimonadales bacterium]|jgi:hypothetical protein|nr:hypothetical protein [Gemmatimonadales bacterium]